MLYGRPFAAYLGHHRTLTEVEPASSNLQHTFPSKITGIVGTARHARCRLIVTYDTGASLCIPTGDELHVIPLEEQIARVRGCFLGDGRAVIWRPVGSGRGELRLYDVEGTRITLRCTTQNVSKVAQPPRAEAHDSLQ